MGPNYLELSPQDTHSETSHPHPLAPSWWSLRCLSQVWSLVKPGLGEGTWGNWGPETELSHPWGKRQNRHHKDIQETLLFPSRSQKHRGITEESGCQGQSRSSSQTQGAAPPARGPSTGGSHTHHTAHSRQFNSKEQSPQVRGPRSGAGQGSC